MGKRDKWKEELADVEAKTLQLQQVLGELEQEQMTLQLKQELLLRIIDGLGVISSCLAEFEQAQIADMTDPGSHQQLLQDVRQQEQLIAQQLAILNCTRQHLRNMPGHQGSIDMMRQMFHPAHVMKVLALRLKDIMARLRTLAGKCAILVFQGSAASSWDKGTAEHMDAAAQADTAAAAVAAARSFAIAAAAHGSGSSSTRSSGTAGSGSSGTSNSEQQQQQAMSSLICHPGIEFVSLVMTIMLWDDERFPVLTNSNLETGEPYLQLPASFWQHVADRLQLTTEQQLMFNILHQRHISEVAEVFQKMGVASKQHEAVSEQLQHHCQVQQQQWWGLELPTKEVKQLQETQADLLKAQCGVMKEWKMLGLHMGIAAMTTLTPHQFALFIAASFPYTPRMDLLLTAIDERVQQQQQLTQQQQAAAAAAAAHTVPVNRKRGQRSASKGAAGVAGTPAFGLNTSGICSQQTHQTS